MTDLKKHIFIIISALIIVVGMAVGTVCHFVSDGFFNYGGEFSSYKSIVVTYISPDENDDTIKKAAENAFDGISPYESSFTSLNGGGGEAVFKFLSSTSDEKIEAAVEKINEALGVNGDDYDNLDVAVAHTDDTVTGSSYSLIYASIAVASAAAFQFIYFVFRYKTRAAISALVACVHNVGVFAALLAITRVPVGYEAIAIASVLVFVTMTATCILFDRTRKNFKDEKFAKTDREEVISLSAKESRGMNLSLIVALAVLTVICGVFAAISSLGAVALAPYAVALIALLSGFYGVVLFTPAVHPLIDGLCEKCVKSRKAPKPADVATKSEPAQEK